MSIVSTNYSNKPSKESSAAFNPSREGSAFRPPLLPQPRSVSTADDSKSLPIQSQEEAKNFCFPSQYSAFHKIPRHGKPAPYPVLPVPSPQAESSNQKTPLSSLTQRITACKYLDHPNTHYVVQLAKKIAERNSSFHVHLIGAFLGINNKHSKNIIKFYTKNASSNKNSQTQKIANLVAKTIYTKEKELLNIENGEVTGPIAELEEELAKYGNPKTKNSNRRKFSSELVANILERNITMGQLSRFLDIPKPRIKEWSIMKNTPSNVILRCLQLISRGWITPQGDCMKNFLTSNYF